MSRPNYFRFKRKFNATSGLASDPVAKHTKKEKDNKGKKQTTISKFFVTSDEKINRTEGTNYNTVLSLNSPTNVSALSSDDDSSVAATIKESNESTVVLCKSTLDKLQKFGQHSSHHVSHGEKLLSIEEDASQRSDNPDLSQDRKISPISKLATFAMISSPTKSKAETSVSKLPIKYTPFEQQIVSFKNKYPGMILLVESGYKYRFFGEDAQIASDELHIMTNMDHNFLTASIPTHRLHVHVRRLVANGHKVGLVKQMETTALKANSANKNSLFARELAAVYTKSTLIGEDVESIPGSSQEDSISIDSTVCSMACIAEIPHRGKGPQRCDIGIVILEPATGEAIYDNFVDLPNRAELEKRLNHTRPVEIIVSTNVSDATKHLISSQPVRIEHLPDSAFQFSESVFLTSEFLDEEYMSQLEQLPPCIVRALAALITHLREFGLTKALNPKGLKPFTTKDTILQMDANSIRNLEIFETSLRNNKGSLSWVLDHTKTNFGSRLLRRWISQPLCTLEPLTERQNAVSEFLRPEVANMVTYMRNILSKLPDLEKDLTSILHGKTNTAGFANLVTNLGNLFQEFKSKEIEIWSIFCNEYVESLFTGAIEHLQGVVVYQENLNLEAAKEGNKTKILKDWSQFPDVVKQLKAVEMVSKKLQDLRPQIARTLGMLSVNYCTVSGMEYLVEIKNNSCCKVPNNWLKISATKYVSRWRPPEVVELFSELRRHRELLAKVCNEAWLRTLQDFSKHYYTHKAALVNVATIDVLMALAQVSKQEGYCRPSLQNGSPRIEIKNGKHPILNHLLSSTQEVVANDTNLGMNQDHCMIITGPNMGGKSSYIRQVALLVIMAQIGCYIPAESAHISLVDAIYTRMGSRDELQLGRSTLLVELEEANVVLHQATPRSLAIFDELGRGTSSCDGAAIAVATLQHILTQTKCLTLFVTHYPVVMTLEQQFPSLVSNYHMGFSLLSNEGENVVAFLYHLERGGAQHSYGLNVAKLAGLPEAILTRADEKAQQLQQQVVVNSSVGDAVKIGRAAAILGAFLL